MTLPQAASILHPLLHSFRSLVSYSPPLLWYNLAQYRRFKCVTSIIDHHAASMHFSLPACVRGFGICRSHKYATTSQMTSWLPFVHAQYQDILTRNPSAPLLQHVAFTTPHSRQRRGYRMALDFIPPSIFILLRIQPQKCFLPEPAVWGLISSNSVYMCSVMPSSRMLASVMDSKCTRDLA